MTRSNVTDLGQLCDREERRDPERKDDRIDDLVAGNIQQQPGCRRKQARKRQRCIEETNVRRAVVLRTDLDQMTKSADACARIDSGGKREDDGV